MKDLRDDPQMIQLADDLQRVPLPAVGLHEEIPAEDYHRWPAASQSRLSQLERSPAHLRAYLQQPPESTKAQEFGTAAHYAVLEPDLFELRYIKGPTDDRRLKAWREFETEHSGMVVLRPMDWTACIAIRDAIQAHPAAKLSLNHHGPRELSGYWVRKADELVPHDVKCKLRIDHLNPELRATVEVKTAIDAREDAFSKAIYNYGYYRQAAWYLDGMATLRPDVGWTHHIIVAIEKEPPYAVNVFRLRDDAIDAGRTELQPLLRKYAECFATNSWPAYGTDFTEISLPPFAWRQIDERLERTAS